MDTGAPRWDTKVIAAVNVTKLWSQRISEVAS
jgi:hypothetical protein